MVESLKYRSQAHPRHLRGGPEGVEETGALARGLGQNRRRRRASQEEGQEVEETSNGSTGIYLYVFRVSV